jgi:hypothetical protein
LKRRKGHFLFEISFPPSNIHFFPGQYFSAGVGKQKKLPGKSSFHDTVILTFLISSIVCQNCPDQGDVNSQLSIKAH